MARPMVENRVYNIITAPRCPGMRRQYETVSDVMAAAVMCALPFHTLSQDNL